MGTQLKRQAVQDLETVEGLLYFNGGQQLRFNEEYHNHPESKLVSGSIARSSLPGRNNSLP